MKQDRVRPLAETRLYCMTTMTSLTTLQSINKAAKSKGRLRPLAEDNQNSGDTPTELHNETNDSTKQSPKRGGGDNPVPGISDDAMNEKIEENSSPRGGKYNLRSNPNPNYTEEYRY